jgi:Galactose oxidase, central domain
MNERQISRRTFLIGGSGLLAAYAVGCGGDDEPSEPTASPAATATGAPGTATASPEPTPGVLGWRRIEASGTPPSGRTDHSLVTDGRSLLLFGGRASGEPQGDYWTFDLTANGWLQPAVGQGPDARFGHNAVYDPARRRMLVFGGQLGGTFFNDAWALEGLAPGWGQLDSTGPSQRYGAASALDADSRLVVSHGFTNRGRFDDTWLLDPGPAWADVSPAANRPVKRCLCRGAWDSQRNRFLMFGGQTDGTPFLGDLWAFDGQEWTEITSEPKPSPRNFYAMAETDPGRIVLFGGNSEDGPGPKNDVWIFDSEADSWTIAEPEGEAPSPRYGHDAVWIPETRRLIVFGGHDNSGDVNDLWELTIPA